LQFKGFNQKYLPSFLLIFGLFVYFHSEINNRSNMTHLKNTTRDSPFKMSPLSKVTQASRLLRVRIPYMKIYFAHFSTYRQILG